MQSIGNFILFVLSYTGFGGGNAVQEWFWRTGDEVGWLAAWTGFILGLYQYYQVFIFGTLIITMCAVGLISLCERPRPPPTAANSNNEGGSGAADNQNRLNRQATSKNLGKLSRMFDWSKFSEHEECVICLLPFESSDMVTPLPCDKRHYFHSKCIE